MSAPGNVRRSTDKDNYTTPPAVFRPLNREFLFRLDAAADASNHRVGRWFGPGGVHEDALSVPWTGYGAVWLNPPYSQTRKWMEKASVEGERVDVVALVPNATDTNWFNDIIWPTAHEIRFVRRRIRFLLDGVEQTRPTGGSILAIWRGYAPKPGRPLVTTWDWSDEGRRSCK